MVGRRAIGEKVVSCHGEFRMAGSLRLVLGEPLIPRRPEIYMAHDKIYKTLSTIIVIVIKKQSSNQKFIKKVCKEYKTELV